MNWIKNSLCFSCHQCGNCCTGDPGYIWCNEKELESLAEFCQLPVEILTQKYVRQVGRHYSLIEKSNGDCIFWNSQQGCMVYPARPQQCQTYPFWPEVIESKASWLKESELCQGIKQGLQGQGKFHPIKSIKETVQIAKRHDPQQG